MKIYDAASDLQPPPMVGKRPADAAAATSGSIAPRPASGTAQRTETSSGERESTRPEAAAGPAIMDGAAAAVTPRSTQTVAAAAVQSAASVGASTGDAASSGATVSSATLPVPATLPALASIPADGTPVLPAQDLQVGPLTPQSLRSDARSASAAEPTPAPKDPSGPVQRATVNAPNAVAGPASIVHAAGTLVNVSTIGIPIGSAAAGAGIASGAGVTTAGAAIPGTVATAAYSPATPDALAASVVAMYHNGQSSLLLRLDPPGLGSVSVHVALGSNADVNVIFVPAVPQTAHLLQAGLGDLRQAMTSAGLSLGQTQIGGGGGFGETGSGSQTPDRGASTPPRIEPRPQPGAGRGARAIA